MKTVELTGAALNWAVSQIEGYEWVIRLNNGKEYWRLFKQGKTLELRHYQPSANWSIAGGIIERCFITLDVATTDYDDEEDDVVRLPKPVWYAAMDSGDDGEILVRGETPLIAAMRCYVVANCGEEIDIPEEVK